MSVGNTLFSNKELISVIVDVSQVLGITAVGSSNHWFSADRKSNGRSFPVFAVVTSTWYVIDGTTHWLMKYGSIM